MNEGVSYSLFYDILLNLREYYYSYGRIDDSNAKLDEIVKLIAVSYSLAKKNIKFNLKYIRNIAQESTGNSNNIASGIINLFKIESKSEIFFNDDGTNIFGSTPSLNLQSSDNKLAEKLISEIEKIDFLYLLKNKQYTNFDIINECFGHFVRENFRNNKEDAQYMTPFEISEPMLDIIFNYIKEDKYIDSLTAENFTIMDPTCGVGTLLIEASNRYIKYIQDSKLKNKAELIEKFINNGMFGQDKVERMVRLSKINTLLLGCNISNIKIGNSISGESYIDKYYNKVDLIFTNPPFGAEYLIKDLDLKNYPILDKINNLYTSVPSELLMLDKCIKLLKRGGYLAIVLPDSVFSAKGFNELYREELLKNYSIKTIIELPPVTFAQAGTRTKTCLMLLKKENISNYIYMCNCKDIGFIVKEKLGVPVKIATKTNDMHAIANVIKNCSKTENYILSENPSVTKVNYNELLDSVLNPNFYDAKRYKVIEDLKNMNKDYTIKKLSEIVNFDTTNRKSYMVSENVKHISVLHINPNCTINFNEVYNFNPISKGRMCKQGDILFSKINPRIPRMTVIPKQDKTLVCSNEFEIMTLKEDSKIDAYTLCFLLKTKDVQTQIDNLTSGTSSSHNRIKREQLSNILVPIPKTKKELDRYKTTNSILEKAVENIYISERNINNQLNILESSKVLVS